MRVDLPSEKDRMGNAPSYGITALLKILATPFTGFLPIMGFSLYLQIGASAAPVVFPSALSCHGMFGTAGLIIFTLLILKSSLFS